jgi:hypothetical protein
VIACDARAWRTRARTHWDLTECCVLGSLCRQGGTSMQGATSIAGACRPSPRAISRHCSHALPQLRPAGTTGSSPRVRARSAIQGGCKPEVRDRSIWAGLENSSVRANTSCTTAVSAGGGNVQIDGPVFEPGPKRLDKRNDQGMCGAPGLQPGCNQSMAGRF